MKEVVQTNTVRASLRDLRLELFGYELVGVSVVNLESTLTMVIELIVASLEMY